MGAQCCATGRCFDKKMGCATLRQFFKVGRVIIHDVDEVLKSRADGKAKKVWQNHMLSTSTADMTLTPGLCDPDTYIH